MDCWFVGGFYNRCCAWFGDRWVFFFFFFSNFVGGFYLGRVCVMVGWWWLLPCWSVWWWWWWLLPCWVCVIVVVPVADGRGGCGAVDLFYWNILFYCISDII